MNAALEQMLKNYQVQNLYDRKNAMTGFTTTPNQSA